MNLLQKLIHKLSKGKWRLVSTSPSVYLLNSMAERYDHSFFCIVPDAEIEEIRKKSPLFGGQMLTFQEREGIIRTMKQLHEEVVGKGFYKL